MTILSHIDTSFCRHALQLGIGVWLQSAWLLVLGIVAGRIAGRRGALAASAVYRGTLVGVAVSTVLGLCLAGHIRPLISVALPSTSTIQRFSVPSTTIVYPSRPLGFTKARKSINLPIVAVRPVVSQRRIATPSISTSPVAHGLYAAILFVIVCIAAVQLLWLVACHAWLWNLRRVSTTLVDGECVDIMRDQAARLGVRCPSIAVSTNVRSPFVAGIVRPCIYLPKGFTEGLSSAELRAILSHELAHIKQCDCMWNAIFRISSAVLWFQPFIWMLRRGWQESSEEVCDQWVLSFDCPPQVYASCLLRLAEGLVVTRPERVAGVGVFSFKSLLGRRVQAILARTQVRLLSLSYRARSAVAVVTIAVAVATVFLISTPARSMVRKQLHRIAAINPVAGYIPSHLEVVKKRSTAQVNVNAKSFFPALLALAGGAFQVNLPADASPDVAPAVSTAASPAATVKPVSITTPSATPTPTADSTQSSAPLAALSNADASVASKFVQVNGDNCSLKFVNVPTIEALTQFFRAYNANFTIADDVSGSVNIEMTNVSKEVALKNILHANSPTLTYDYTDGIYYVKVRHRVNGDVGPDYNSSNGPVTAVSPSDAPAEETSAYKCPIDHMAASVLLAHLRMFSDSGGVSLPPRAQIVALDADNSLLIHCTAEDFAKLRDLIKQVDIEPSTVSVSIKVVNTNEGDLKRIGIDPANIDGGLSIEDQKKLNAALSKGKFNIYADPLITTTSGVKGSVSFHSEGSNRSGITIDVTPTVTSNRSILVATHIDETAALDPGSSETHSFDINQTLRSGETFLIAALRQDGDKSHAGEYRLVFATAVVGEGAEEREIEAGSADAATNR